MILAGVSEMEKPFLCDPVEAKGAGIWILH